MESQRFDDMTRTLTSIPSRRGVLRALAVAGLPPRCSELARKCRGEAQAQDAQEAQEAQTAAPAAAAGRAGLQSLRLY